MELDQIIALLEGQSDPDRRLDCLIAIHPATPHVGVRKFDSGINAGDLLETLLGPRHFGISGVDQYVTDEDDVAQYLPKTCADQLGIPNYSASIDAALTLIPAGYDWHIEPDGAWIRWLSKDDVEEAQSVLLQRGGRCTPLAICAAALKARFVGLAP